MASSILILNGPNLNLLGTRETAIYGHESLADIEAQCRRHAEGLGFGLEFRQTNLEGELVGWIQAAAGTHAGIMLNAGAYSHTSIAIPDALKAVGLPVVEVHLTNIHRRESFRHRSHVSAVANGVICGFGGHGYLIGLDAMARLLVSND